MDNQTPIPPQQPMKRSWAMTRMRLKLAARMQYGVNIKTCVPVALIGSVATYIFSMILNLRMPSYEELTAAQDMTVFLPQLLKVNGLSLLFGFILSPLTIGSYGFFTRLIRNEKPKVFELFAWLGEGKKVAAAYMGQLIYLLYTLLWSALLIGIPGALYVGAGNLIGAEAGTLQVMIFLLAGLLFCAMTVLGSAKAMTYQPALFILGADPELGVKHAFAICRERMRGHMWEYFIFQLSFLGWQLIASFTCGIGMLFVQPYMNLSNAAFVEFVRGNPIAQPQMPRPQSPFEHRDDDDEGEKK